MQIYSCIRWVVQSPRKETLGELSASTLKLENANIWFELDGQPITKGSLRDFLNQQKTVAVRYAEKLAGFTARVRQRGGWTFLFMRRVFL